MYRPLADVLRPTSLDEIVGQGHLLGKNGLLRRVIESGTIPNMVFYGPSGIGKTTVANIIAKQNNRSLYKLNATTSGIADIKAIIEQLDGLQNRDGVLLYLDEIQYFNKKQQQSLLEFIENGRITLIASTTENPYFYIYNAILSRCTVFEFKPVEKDEIKKAVLRAFTKAGENAGLEIDFADEVADTISSGCGGDVRKAVNAVELLTGAAREKDGKLEVVPEDVALVAQRSAMRYDRDGDAHYDILSAFQKSVRGSDPDAALHYLARLLEAGDLPSACRRLLVMAAEDVGIAYPAAIMLTKACVDAALQLGMPEAQLPLGEAVVLLATAPKSNASANGIWAAMSDVAAGKTGDIPDHLKDAHYSGAKKLGRGLTYKYPHGFPNHWTAQQYLPDNIKNAKYFNYGDSKLEQQTKKYWDDIKKAGKND